MKYMILDLETQTHQRFKRKANPFLEENYIVARGWKVQGDHCCTSEFYDDKDSVPELIIPHDVDVIVAHNAKFELLYEMRFSSKSLHAFFKRGGRIWCTQYAEYLLRAQDRKYHMCALNDLAPQYGGTNKVDGIKELWDAGVQTSDIDRDLLNDYLIGTLEEGRNGGDIGNTELIYLGQLKEAEQEGMMNSLLLRMDALCAISDMEYRGLKIDIARARANLKKLTTELKEADASLGKYTKEIPDKVKFNWGSNTHKSAIIFGGTIKYEYQTTYIDENTGELARKKAKEPWPLFDGVPIDPVKLYKDGDYYFLDEDCDHKQDIFKSGKKIGQPKFKQVEVPGELKVKYQPFLYKLDGYTDPDPSWAGALTDGIGNPVYSTSSDVIDQITKRDIPFLKALGRKTTLDKEIGTYYVKVHPKTGEKTGMITCVQPWDHFVHHKLNNVNTVTTRLSSSDPNLQNLTRADFDAETGLYKSEVKSLFISRFEDGTMVEIDYSQLEVVVQGLLTLDVNLCKDLNNKVDFHCKRVALKNSVSYDFALDACKNEGHPEYAKWKKERTKCKIFSFQRAYGAGATLIADETGMDVEEVKGLIDAEEAEYPGVVKFNERVEAEVGETAEPFYDPELSGTYRKGTFQVFTGTKYTFRSYDAPSFLRKRGIKDTFKPTELKNYPVQGSGGEIVLMVLGYLWRWFIKNDYWDGRAYLVNTVHDCVWADTDSSVTDEVAAGMQRIMQAVPQMLKKNFNTDCPVPFPVDVEVGKNMLELGHWQN